MAPRNFSRLRYEPTLVHSYRLLTTPATHPAPKATGSDLPQLQSVPSRKQKIELRPGPVKAPPTNQPNPSTVTTAGPVVVEKDVKKASDPTPQPGVVESAKIDYGEAARHGILAPPPAGASKIGKLWHQAKEYFVRPSEPITHHLDIQQTPFLEILCQGPETR